MGKYKISGVPIVDNVGKLVGIITNRDMRFLSDYNGPISEVMTKDHLITAPVGTTMEEAQAILRKHKIEKLPLVDEEGYLKGLITIKDIEKAVQFPNSARDEKGRLLCGAAIGITANVLERAHALVDAQVDVLVLDSAHGHSKNIMTTLKKVKEAFPHVPVIAGNIATAEAAEALIELVQTLLRSASDLAPFVPPVSLPASACRRSPQSMTWLRWQRSTTFRSSQTAVSSTPATL